LVPTDRDVHEPSVAFEGTEDNPHTQLLADEEPGREVEIPGHMFWSPPLHQEPAGHATHVLPLAYVALGHVWHELCPMPEYGMVPAGHGAHVTEEVAPGDEEYVYAGHGVQAEDADRPVVFDHVPAAHSAGLPLRTTQ